MKPPAAAATPCLRQNSRRTCSESHTGSRKRQRHLHEPVHMFGSVLQSISSTTASFSASAPSERAAAKAFAKLWLRGTHHRSRPSAHTAASNAATTTTALLSWSWQRSLRALNGLFVSSRRGFLRLQVARQARRLIVETYFFPCPALPAIAPSTAESPAPRNPNKDYNPLEGKAQRTMNEGKSGGKIGGEQRSAKPYVELRQPWSTARREEEAEGIRKLITYFIAA